MESFSAEKARQNKGKIEYILRTINAASESHNHLFLSGSIKPHSQQLTTLRLLHYKIDKCNWFDRVFRKRHYKISW
jgi:hypothetical protein